jgi:N-acetylglucosaminyldiphosphoundecaprenol N-acetyl-beta-D-mannosaminyltransferase
MPVADVELDVLTEAETVERIVASGLAGEGGLVVTPNVDHLHKIATGSWLGSVYAEADLVVADGMPLVWASRLLGEPLPERVAGSHLLLSLTEAAARNGLSIYLLGGTPGAAVEAAERFTQRWPELKVAGTSCPPRGFERAHGGIEAVCDDVVAAAPDVVFTALGAPKQEYLNLALRHAYPAAWYLGVGGAVDMAAGIVRRAPVWAQRSGTEWIFRMAQEPGRMARRYLVDDTPFALKLLAASARMGKERRWGS